VEEPKPRVVAGINWGMNTPVVMLAAEYTSKPMDHLQIIREVYKPGLDVETIITIAKDWMKELAVRKFFCDPTQAETIAMIRRRRIWAVAVEGEIGLAVGLVRRRIANQKNGPQGGLTVSRECPRIIPEFQAYHAPPLDPRKPYRDKPVDVYNHALGALHCIVLGLIHDSIPRMRWL